MKPLRPYWLVLKCRRLKCWCRGYWFPHRRGGGACEHSPRADYYTALRAGLSQAEAMALLPANVLEEMFPLQENR